MREKNLLNFVLRSPSPPELCRSSEQLSRAGITNKLVTCPTTPFGRADRN